MSTILTEPSTFKLSMCVSTFNRAKFIRDTLESIISQATNDCEIVVSDNASTDGTEHVVAECASRFDRLRYVKQSTNNGFDHNFDRAVELARGEYCWLVSDDDLLKPGAVATVLEALCNDFSLILVNYERRDATMSKILAPRATDVVSNRIYAPEELDRLFLETRSVSIYVGSVVIRREIWLTRERQKYFGSMLIHMAMIYQAPLPRKTLLVAEPFISYRVGNTTTFWPSSFEILVISYPSLVWTLALSEAAKKSVCCAEPSKNLRLLLFCRAMGWYSLAEYHRWIHPKRPPRRVPSIPWFIARLPGVLVNTVYLLYYTLAIYHRHRTLSLYSLRRSRFYLGSA